MGSQRVGHNWVTFTFTFSSCLVTKSCPTLCDPRNCSPARLLCPCGFSRPEYWRGLSCPPPGDLPNPGIEPRSPTLQADSLPAELPGKLKNTGVGSQSLLQGIFLTQESNEGLLHCRQILYQLNYQGSCYSYPAAAAAAKSLQSCPTLCDSIDGSPPGSPVPEILQARTLEWVAISFSNA